MSLGNCSREKKEEREGEVGEKEVNMKMVVQKRDTVQLHLSLDFCSKNSCVSSSRMVCRHFLQHNMT